MLIAIVEIVTVEIVIVEDAIVTAVDVIVEGVEIADGEITLRIISSLVIVDVETSATLSLGEITQKLTSDNGGCEE